MRPCSFCEDQGAENVFIFFRSVHIQYTVTKNGVSQYKEERYLKTKQDHDKRRKRL